MQNITISGIELQNTLQMFTLDSEEQEAIFKMRKEKILNELLTRYTLPAEKDASGYYTINLKACDSIDGKRGKIRGKSLEELKDKLVEKFLNSQNRTMSFKECFESKEEKLPTYYSVDKQNQARSTIKRHRNTYRKYFTGTSFENKEMIKITSSDITDFLSQCFDKTIEIVEKDGSKKSEKIRITKGEFENITGIISTTFKFALKDTSNCPLSINPFLAVDLSQFVGKYSLPTDIFERIYTQEEIDKMEEYIIEKEKTQISAFAFEFQLITGRRRGEIPLLKWSDIKFKTENDKEISFIHLSHRLDEYGNCVRGLKSNHLSCNHPCYSDILDFLKRLKAFHISNGLESEYLFPGNHKEYGTINYSTISDFHKRMCKSLNIKLSHSAMKGGHSFRRIHITNFIDNGGSKDHAAQIWGNSVKAIDNAYLTELSMSNSCSVMEKSSIRHH